MITRYIRNTNNAPIGTIVADEKDGKVYVGWAWTSKKDHPCKQIGVDIACGRMDLPEIIITNLLNDARKGFMQKETCSIIGYTGKYRRIPEIIASEVFRMAIKAQQELITVE